MAWKKFYEYLPVYGTFSNKSLEILLDKYAAQMLKCLCMNSLLPLLYRNQLCWDYFSWMSSVLLQNIINSNCRKKMGYALMFLNCRKKMPCKQNNQITLICRYSYLYLHIHHIFTFEYTYVHIYWFTFVYLDTWVHIYSLRCTLFLFIFLFN